MATVQTKTWPISVKPSTRSALIDSQAMRTVVTRPPSARAGGTGGILRDAARPSAASRARNSGAPKLQFTPVKPVSFPPGT